MIPSFIFTLLYSLLLRIAAFLGFTRPGKWGGLPEDVFVKILNEYVDTDIRTARSLATACRAYATFSRQYMFRRVSLGSVRAVKEFRVVLGRSSWIMDGVQTLRITDTDREMQLQETGPESVALSPTGEGLQYILSQKFSQLKTLELPLLHGKHQWDILAPDLRLTIHKFLRDHNLQEVSITTHYPLEVLLPCANLRRLEYRIHPESTAHTLNTSSSTLASKFNPLFPPLMLEELVIQDPHNQASSFALYLTGPSSSVSLDKLKTLTYYGNNDLGKQLGHLLRQSADTLTTLSVFVGAIGEYSLSCHRCTPPHDSFQPPQRAMAFSSTSHYLNASPVLPCQLTGFDQERTQPAGCTGLFLCDCAMT